MRFGYIYKALVCSENIFADARYRSDIIDIFRISELKSARFVEASDWHILMFTVKCRRFTLNVQKSTRSWRKTAQGIYFLHVAAVNVWKTCSPGVLNSRYSAGRSQIMYRVHQSSREKWLSPGFSIPWWRLRSELSVFLVMRLAQPEIRYLSCRLMQFILQFDVRGTLSCEYFAK